MASIIITKIVIRFTKNERFAECKSPDDSTNSCRSCKPILCPNPVDILIITVMKPIPPT